MIYKFLKNPKNNQKFGVMTADVYEGKMIVAWAVCHPKKDHFTKQRGLEIAVGRAEKGHCSVKAPQSIRGELIQFANRSQKYFKQANSYQILGL